MDTGHSLRSRVPVAGSTMTKVVTGYTRSGTMMKKQLPVEVRRLVASSYLDYTIRTEEIEAPRDVRFHIIHLEGETDWINIKVSDNEISELEKIKKS